MSDIVQKSTDYRIKQIELAEAAAKKQLEDLKKRREQSARI